MTLPWRALAVRPGERVTIDAAPGVWRVDRWSFENMVLSFECVPVVAAPLSRPASAGRVLPAPDRLPGATILHAFELPPLGDTPAAAPRLGIAAAGSAAGWRNAALLLSTDGGQSWSEAGTTALPAVIGTLITPPGPALATLIDRRNTVEVELAHNDMTLADADADADADDAALSIGANLALIGDELIQFARAAPTEANRWWLSGLWRGRRGTEAAAGHQTAGDRFVLLQPETLAVLDLPASTLGGTLRLLAQGVGDSGTAEAVVAITGISVLPPAPAQLAFAPAADGGGMVRWTRRSRAGWDWLGGVDAPRAEEREAYRVSIHSGAVRRDLDTDVPWVTLTPGECAAGATIEVRQLGARGLSSEALLILL